MTEKKLKKLLNTLHKDWKRLGQNYGYCHPMTERRKLDLERVRYMLGALTKQEV